MAALRSGLAADYERWDRLELTDDEEDEGNTSSAVRVYPAPERPLHARGFCVCMRRRHARVRAEPHRASAGAHCGAAGVFPPGPRCPAGA